MTLNPQVHADRSAHPATQRRMWQVLVSSPGPIRLCSHVGVDGDGLGAMLGLWHILRTAGIESAMVLDSEVPEVYRFLPGSEAVGPPDADAAPADVMVSLDSASASRLGACEKLLRSARQALNIDHHVSNEGFGHLHLIDPHASSTSEMILDLALTLDLKVTPQAAECLYTGIITDTGRFCHTNTTETALMAAAKLVLFGADPARVGLEVYKSLDFRLLRLRTLAMETIRLEAGGRVAVMELRRAMFEQTGTRPIDTQEFVDIPASVRGVEVAVLLREHVDGPGTKASLRSKNTVDVSRLAVRFGGGGHRRAAGFDSDLPLDGLRAVVLDALREEMGAGPPT